MHYLLVGELGFADAHDLRPNVLEGLLGDRLSIHQSVEPISVDFPRPVNVASLWQFFLNQLLDFPECNDLQLFHAFRLHVVLEDDPRDIISELVLRVPDVLLLDYVQVVRADLLHVQHRRLKGNHGRRSEIQDHFDGHRVFLDELVLDDEVAEPLLAVPHEQLPRFQVLAHQMVRGLDSACHDREEVTTSLEQLLGLPVCTLLVAAVCLGLRQELEAVRDALHAMFETAWVNLALLLELMESAIDGALNVISEPDLELVIRDAIVLGLNRLLTRASVGQIFVI